MKIVAETASAAPDPSSAAQAAPPTAARTGADRTVQAANVRLVIEEDARTGAFIYKTVDRTTGEVILQLPREEVLKAVLTGTYTAGDVVKARA